MNLLKDEAFVWKRNASENNLCIVTDKRLKILV
jgi:hypothetical protein